GVALAVADRALGRRRAPGVLQRVPAQAALPGDVDGGGRVAVTAEALVALARQRDGAPRPAQLPALLVRPVEGVAHDGRAQPGLVGRVQVREGALLDDGVVVDGPRFAVDHLPVVHVELTLAARTDGVGAAGRQRLAETGDRNAGAHEGPDHLRHRFLIRC